MDYFAIKTLHQAAVALSITGFFARGLGSLLGAAWVGGRLAKTGFFRLTRVNHMKLRHPRAGGDPGARASALSEGGSPGFPPSRE